MFARRGAAQQARHQQGVTAVVKSSTARQLSLMSSRSIVPHSHQTSNRIVSSMPYCGGNRCYRRTFHKDSYTMIEELAQPTMTPTESVVVDCVAWFVAFFTLIWIPSYAVGDEFTTDTDQLDYQSLEEMEDEADRQHHQHAHEHEHTSSKNTKRTTNQKEKDPKQQDRE